MREEGRPRSPPQPPSRRRRYIPAAVPSISPLPRQKTPQRYQVGAHRDEKAPKTGEVSAGKTHQDEKPSKTGEVCISVTHHAKPIGLRRAWEARPTGVECTLTSLLARKMPESVVVWYHNSRSACQEIKGEDQG